MSKKIVVIGIIVFTGLALGFIPRLFVRNTAQPIASAKTVTVYKSPTCGCCVQYVAMLKKNGYDVEVKERTDMHTIKDEYGISREMESCHTSLFGDYIVEGHVPLAMVEKLLYEKPDIRGIALPDMPAGSPGMPGKKRGPFTIYSLLENGTDIFEHY